MELPNRRILSRWSAIQKLEPIVAKGLVTSLRRQIPCQKPRTSALRADIGSDPSGEAPSWKVGDSGPRARLAGPDPTETKRRVIAAARHFYESGVIRQMAALSTLTKSDLRRR